MHAVKRSPVLLIGAAAIAISFPVAVYLRLRTPGREMAAREPEPAGPAPSSEEVTGLRRELATLRAQLTELRRDVSSARDQGGSEKAGPPADTRTRDQIKADDDRRYREYMAGVAEAFRQEPVDPRWATRVSATVHGAITNDEVIRSLVRDVECRSHSCRVTIEETSADFIKLNKELPAFATSLAESLPSVSAEHLQDGSGSGSVVLYMSSRPDQAATASR
jgi:hypothetical protein